MDGVSRAPTDADDAECVPNDAQAVEWKSEEDAAYALFWVVVSLVVVAVVAASLFFALRAEPGKATRIKRSVTCLWVGLHTLDLATDFGFLVESVQTPRFEHLMKEDGLSCAAFEGFAILFCTLTMFLHIPDLCALRWKHVANERAQPPPLSSVIITGLVAVCEDVGQFFLGVTCPDVTRRADAAMCDECREGVDGLAVFSLLISMTSLTCNVLSIAKPSWLYTIVDKETGKPLERPSDPVGRRISTISGTAKDVEARSSSMTNDAAATVVFDNQATDDAASEVDSASGRRRCPLQL